MSDLVDRAQEGRLSRDELDAVAERLQRDDTFEHVRDHLLVMQFAGDSRYQRAVERYLDFRRDTTIVSRALQVLCFNWDLADRYFDWLVGFVEGVDWDLVWTTREVRSEAFILAGWYLAKRRSRTLLGLLLRIAEDPTELQWARAEAASALFSALAPWPHWSPAALELDDPRHPGTIRGARERLASEPDLPPHQGRVPMPRRVELPGYAVRSLPAGALRSDLVDRARRGGIPGEELDTLARELGQPLTGSQAQERLLALLYGGDARYREAVERHLGADDPDTAAVALVVLTSGWKLTGEYLHWLVGFIEHGQPELRRLALTIAGAHLATRRSRELLALLVRVAEDESRPRARAQAVIALHHTFGVPPTLPTEEDLDEKDVTFVLEPARERLEAE